MVNFVVNIPRQFTINSLVFIILLSFFTYVRSVEAVKLEFLTNLDNIKNIDTNSRTQEHLTYKYALRNNLERDVGTRFLLDKNLKKWNTISIEVSSAVSALG